MKVLWIINNIILPDVAVELNLKPSNLGGWIVGGINQLRKSNEIELSVVSISSEVTSLKKVNVDGIQYFVVPLTSKQMSSYQPHLEGTWKTIEAEIKPDVVHIHGTEFAHGLAWIKACGNQNVIASIQGLTSVYARYAKGSISNWDILKTITLKDLVMKSSIFHVRNNFKRRGKVEQEYLINLSHVIGRTEWDKSHAMAINPSIRYHFCNESLRPAFYNHEQWDYERCEKHSIFLSQARSPIKGAHMMLRALPLILRRYPDTKVYIGNSHGIYVQGFKKKLAQSGYYRLLREFIEKYNLEKHIICLPPLNEEQMANQFVNSHVFVNASAIENSPNSLGEAQLLGVPCISSFVGGTPEFMGHGKAGKLYRFEEYEMLADAICRIFDSKYVPEEVSVGRELASGRHDLEKNGDTLLEIYRNIIKLDNDQ